jgi:small-conductance mechanosensitive channel
MRIGARVCATLAVLLALTAAFAQRAAGDSLATTADSAAKARALAATAADSTAGSGAEAGAAPGLAAQTAEEPASAESVGAARAAVPVFLGGRQIFTVRSARNGLAPAARAAAIRARLDAAVRDLETPADSVWMRRTPEGIEVRLGRHFLWMIAPGDIEGMTMPNLAKLVSELPLRVSQGIARERAGRSPLGILMAALIALGITIVGLVLVRLLIAASRRWRGFLDRSLPKYLAGIRIGTFEVLSQAQLTGVFGGILARLDLVVGLLLLYGYLTAVFSLFPISQGWSWRLLSFAWDQLVLAAFAVGSAIPGLLVLVVIVIVFRWLTGISDRFFEAIAEGALKVGWIHQELARPTKRLVRILLWISAAAIAYPYIPGSQSKAVQGISILLGVMVSLGSSGFVSNIIAGIVLTYSRSFSAGDRVKIGEQLGDVVNLGFFATKLHSPRNEEITLPNGQVAAQPIINYTRLAAEEGLVLHTQVTIGYDTDWRTVHALLIEAAGRVEGVEREREPWVFQRSLNDFHITYEICCLTKETHEQLRLYSRLHEEIQDAFARAGVEILSPAFNALRDANAPELPREPKGPRAAPGGFRVRPQGDA